jgi:hypothetical protein
VVAPPRRPPHHHRNLVWFAGNFIGLGLNDEQLNMSEREDGEPRERKTNGERRFFSK